MTTASLDFYQDVNQVAKEERISPSGKFRLLIRNYKTKEGCWNYSRGTVYRILDGQEICDIKRNYSRFHHSFVTKNQQEWLITGRSYMSQTLVNLETSQILEPQIKERGGEFCWTSAFLSPDENTLVVDGCHWACPYEYKFFDFTNPSQGWPELETEDYFDLDDQKPEFVEDKIIYYRTQMKFKSLNKYDAELDSVDLEKISDADYEDKAKWEQVLLEKRIYRRQDNKLILLDSWISEEEQARRQAEEEAEKKFEVWIADFKENDPLYLKYLESLQKYPYFKSGYASYGSTYLGWAPDFKENETRWCNHLLQKDLKNPFTISLEWAVKTGPIKLVIFKNGSSLEDQFFVHSPEGMAQAFQYADSLYRGQS